MNLSFMKDGKKVECCPVERAVHGQMLVYIEGMVTLDGYESPAIFRVTRVTRQPDFGVNVYELQDDSGRRLETPLLAQFFDAQEWITWSEAKRHEDERRAKRRNELLQAQVDLLSSILTRQGVRIVTEEQARELGLR